MKNKGILKKSEAINYNMSKIRSSGSKIETILASLMWKEGLRYRKQYKIFGKPDFAFVKNKVAIFCDSSFWHGYKNMRTSRHNFKSNKEFWFKKIKNNINRDKKVNSHLIKEGWIVIRFWDFQIITNTDKCVQKIKRAIQE